MNTAHFFVDSDPEIEFVYLDLLSQNTVSKILASWVASWLEGSRQVSAWPSSDEMEE